MSSITGINSYLYNNYSSLGAINTSTEKFKGSVTGYKPVQKNTVSTYSDALSSSDTKSYMAALKESGTALKSAAANLSTTGQSVFSKLTATSSKDDALTVSVSKQTDAANASQNTKAVSVQQLATAQKNIGASRNATSISGATNGNNAFTIEKDGKTHSFNVNINATDSVRTAQQKMADAINKQGVGVTATVESDAKGKSSLVLAAKDTGEKNAFVIADAQGRGNLVETLGVGQAAQEARDARYTVNGMQQTSDSNTVELGDGTTGTLKKTTTEDVKVTSGKDVNGILNAVKDVVNGFNDLREVTKDYGEDKNAQALTQRLDSISSSYASSLQQIGITRDQDGYLQIDEKKLTSAFENGSAEKYLGDSSNGFTQRVSQLASSVAKNPDQYVSYRSKNNMDGESAGAYSTVSNNSYQDYLMAYRSSQLDNLGLLFSMGV